MERFTLAAAVVTVTLLGNVDPALAQSEAPVTFIETQSLARGYDPTKAYSGSDFDQINTYNGNLTVRVPLGPAYSLGPSLSYQLALHYNGNGWQFEQEIADPASPPGGGPSCGTYRTAAIPMPDANAGLGWKLSLGELYPPNAGWHLVRENWSEVNPNKSSSAYLFIAPDGSRHTFFSRFHVGSVPPIPPPPAGSSLYFTNNRTFARLSVNRSIRSATLDLPDGTTFKFYEVDPSGYAGQGRYRLSRIEDSNRSSAGVSRNYLDIRYSADENDWELVDSVGRRHEVEFSTAVQHTGGVYPRVAKTVRLAGLLGNAPNSGVVYDLDYDATHAVARATGHQVLWTGSPVYGFSVDTMPLLTGVRTPQDGAVRPKFAFSYYHAGNAHPGTISASDVAGRMERMTLPTGGSVEWTYQLYSFPRSPVPACSQPGQICINNNLQTTRATGVKTRTVTEPVTNVTGTWHYIPGRVFQDSLVAPGTPAPCTAWRENHTVVFDPEKNARVYFYSAYAGSNHTVYQTSPSGEPWDLEDLGLPFTRLEESYSQGLRAGDPPVYLSSEVWECDSQFDPTAYNPQLQGPYVRTTPGDAAYGCIKQQERYVRYHHDLNGGTCSEYGVGGFEFYHCGDRNRRRITERTVTYEYRQSDMSLAGKEVVQKDYLDWDGLGHFRKTVTTANWERDLLAGDPDGDRTGIANWKTRIARTEFNPAAGSPSPGEGPNWVPDPLDPWILGTFGATSLQETVGYKPAQGLHQVNNPPGDRQKRLKKTCYDPDTGLLLGQRTLKNLGRAGGQPANGELGDPQENDADLLLIYDYRTDGRLIAERFYGGDARTGTRPAAGCNDPGGTPEFEREHTYTSEGFFESTTVRDGTGLLSLVALENTEINPILGLVTASLDARGLETTADYDSLGRFTEVTPPGEAPSEFAYQPASASNPGNNPAIVTVTRGDTEAVTVLDGLGRVHKQRQLLPGGQRSEVVTRYRPSGVLLSRSTPAAVGATPPSLTQYRDYDAFDRARVVRMPDGQEISRWYQGARNTRTTKSIACGLDGQRNNFNSWENRGPFGRVTSVLEYSQMDPSVPADPCHKGSNVLTKYFYEIGGNLGLTQTQTSTSGRQRRWFDYDGRGLLQGEWHPEIADYAPGSPYNVAYGGYNALGTPESRITGASGFHLGYSYDRLGRLIEIRDQERNRPLVENFYAAETSTSSNDGFGGALLAGQLYQAKRHNYPSVDHPGEPPVTVTETYVYDGPNARVSRREVQTTEGPSFDLGVGYDGQGNPTSLAYPCNFGLSSCDPNDLRTVDLSYQTGRLIGVTSQIGTQPSLQLAQLDYHRNGLVENVTHGNGVVWNQTIPTNGMPRIKSLFTTGATGSAAGHSGNWSSGDFLYDEGGNVYAIGTDRYAYDAVGRLRQADVQFPQAGGGTGSRGIDYRYDRFGNLLEVDGRDGPGSSQQIPVRESTNRLYGSSYSYDSAGNLTEMGSLSKLEYDPLGMATLTRGLGVNRRYLYTADNERIVTRNFMGIGGLRDDTWTLRGLDHKVLRQETFQAGSGWIERRDYVHRGAALFASFDAQGNQRHHHPDHLGTPRLVTDELGQVVAYHEYLPFGTELTLRNQADGVLQFTGHERDPNCETCTAPETDDLDYMHARHYSLYLGRFLSVDPIMQIKRAQKMPQLWNRYAYGVGNPLNYVDPTGKILELTGTEEEQRDAFANILNTVPVELRMFVRTRTTKDGRVIIDDRYLNAKRNSASGNFQALRQIANSPATVLFNSASTVVNTPSGSETIGAKSMTAGLTLSSQQSVSGRIEAYTGGDLNARNSAVTTAHELRHARRYLLGLPSLDETITTFQQVKGGMSILIGWDPKGPVNIETGGAEEEAMRNYDPFVPWPN